MQSKYLTRTVLCAALLAAFAGCGKRGEAASEIASEQARTPSPAAAAEGRAKADSMRQPRGFAADSSMMGGAALDTQAQLGSSAAEPSPFDGERKFIRTAHVHFRVKNVYQAALAIEDAVAGQSGFVIKNHIGASVQRTQRRPIGEGKVSELAEYVVNGHLIVRVPGNKTQDFLRAIAGQVAFLDQRSFDARDAQFDLLRQQLDYRRNQETQEDLGQAAGDGGKLRHKTEAIVNRNETKAARDRARVAQKEFEDQIAFSTIQLSLYQLPEIRETEVLDVDALFHEKRPAFSGRLAAALGAGWNGTLDLLIQLARLWPLWLALAGAVAVFRRFRAGRRAAAQGG